MVREVTLASRVVVSAGETPLLGVKRLSVFLPRGSMFYLKWEGANPTHTHKDRAALAHVRRAVEEGFDAVTAGTCGNFGVALAYYAGVYGLDAVIYVPARYGNARLGEMRGYGARVVKVQGGYEEAVEASVEAARMNGWYDANPGSVNDDVALEGYGAIAVEVFRRLGRVPDVVAVPVGNGITLAGVYRGFRGLVEEGLAGRVPRVVGGTTAYGNQVLEAWLRGDSCSAGDGVVLETRVNEPLVALRSLNCREALEAVRSSGGAVYGFRDEELVFAAHMVERLEGARPLPASAAAVLAAVRYGSVKRVRGVYVAVVTGGAPV